MFLHTVVVSIDLYFCVFCSTVPQAYWYSFFTKYIIDLIAVLTLPFSFSFRVL